MSLTFVIAGFILKMKMKLSKPVYYKFGDILSRKGEFWDIGFLKCV